jgi:hypothetical protein
MGVALGDNKLAKAMHLIFLESSCKFKALAILIYLA